MIQPGRKTKAFPKATLAVQIVFHLAIQKLTPIFLFLFSLLFASLCFTLLLSTRFHARISLSHTHNSHSVAQKQKNNERHFVQHHYHDHAMDDDDVIIDDSHHEDEDHHSYGGAVSGESSEAGNATDDPQQKKKRRGGVSISFPMKLHAVLEQMDTDGYSSILSWQPHGRAFKINKPKEFTEYVMPHYFRQSKLTSFQRQLNLVSLSLSLSHALLDWKHATLE